MARDTGQDVIDAFFDLALEDDLKTEFLAATMNTDAVAVAEIFMHPAAVLGLSDAGAHITMFSEAGQTSQLLGHYPATIACHDEEIVHDMPDGGPRYIARSSGIRWSFVNGRPVIRDGRVPEPDAVSGAGRVIRAA